MIVNLFKDGAEKLGALGGYGAGKLIKK